MRREPLASFQNGFGNYSSLLDFTLQEERGLKTESDAPALAKTSNSINLLKTDNIS